ncbi:DUF5700 domain-containing putative Zn-dependent protease [Sporosalibacterium faouarense]|uniref:DUF5700 domain-containing putative Zn-dependent protease n=1 Tax=Sporosalibacterium faouarense TaxID=516123 RepID=UPI00141CC458|nr:DUF5700 domain-containing putative Zn-dependent protease [Sporosalibacterium faouarense]MTI47463.1 hypothetical protein [Bacillota bacterium]
MKINIRFDTIDEMLNLCRQVKEGKLEISRLEKLLDHDDYQVEFQRYKGRVSRKEFINFFSNFPNLEYEEITNKDFKVHYDHFKYLFDNLDLYEKECKKLKDFSEEMFMEQTNHALKGLPENVNLHELNFIFTISIGMSYGWVYENNSHYDFIQMIKNSSVEEFKACLAHEIHHIGMNSIFDNSKIANFSPEELFYLYFAGEGLAVKYCNNAQGKLSNSIYDGEKNIGLDSFTWNYLNDEFDENFKVFKEHINKMRMGEITSQEGVMKIIQEYWMNFHTKDQEQNEPPKLKQGRWYAFGNDIWGVIHDVFGRAKVFEILEDLSEFPEVYNMAVTKIGKEEYMI